MFLFLQKATPPPMENKGANTTSVGTDMLADTAVIIKDRPVSTLLIRNHKTNHSVNMSLINVD